MTKNHEQVASYMMQPHKLDRVDGQMSCINLVIIFMIYHVKLLDFQICASVVHE